MLYYDETLKTYDSEDLIPFKSILATVDKNKSNILFIIYIKNVSENKILGRIYKYKDNTLITDSEETQDCNEFVVAKIVNKKLNILEKISEKLRDEDKKNLIKNKYALLIIKQRKKIQSKRYFQSVKLYPYWINKGSTPLLPIKKRQKTTKKNKKRQKSETRNLEHLFRRVFY